MRRSDSHPAADTPSVPSSEVPAAAGFAMGGGAVVPPASPTVLLHGKLMRRDRTFLTWKWRDFVLEKNRLQYFSEKKGTRKGEIPLTPTTPITIRLLNEPKPFAFILFIKDEKLTLAALNDMERRKWIDVFCDVFHASVEQQAHNEKADRRTRPTFLPIPDMMNSSSYSLHSAASTSTMVPRNSMEGIEASGSVNGDPTSSDRYSFGADVIPILESRMTYGPMKETYSRVTFPPSLANGDLLVGVGPIVRRMGWTDERILAVGFYIDPENATKELDVFNGRTTKSLYGDQSFYEHLLLQTSFRRSFVVTSRKRVSKSVLIALLRDEIAPRLGNPSDALDTFLGFIDKSLKKAESMVLQLNPDGRFEFRLRGHLYPPIASDILCKCIQAIFFDMNSIQHDAKRGLIERLPSLWGGEALDAHDEIFGRVRSKKGEEVDSDSDDEDDEDDDEFHFEAEDEFEEDDEDVDEDEIEENGDTENSIENNGEHASRVSRRSSRFSQRKRNISRKDALDELDEREHERLRRESTKVLPHFGPLLDPDSNAHFGGDLLVDGSALLGTWSQEITLPPEAYDQPYDGRSYRFSVGLYADPVGASEHLLKYKGLSLGSIMQDPDFFGKFARGPFAKHFVFKVDTKIRLVTLLDFFETHLRQLSLTPLRSSLLVPLSSSSLPAKTETPSTAEGPSGSAGATNSSTEPETLLDIPYEYQQKLLQTKDDVRFSITANGNMSMTVRKHFLDRKISNIDDTAPSEPTAIEEVKLPPPPFAMGFQSIFYGFHTMDTNSRAQLLQRLPTLLDLAKDDLVHTYHDEIQVLKENYKRQKPENRVKVGYLLLAFEKMKKTKSDTGIKESMVVASRWSKRWCRLDGTSFSYYSHKRSRKARDVVDLRTCEVTEITSTKERPELSRFAGDKGSGGVDSIRIAIIKPSGGILALRTESIYEGEEWLESLIDASKVRRHSIESSTAGQWDANMAQLRRRSSSARIMNRAMSTSSHNGTHDAHERVNDGVLRSSDGDADDTQHERLADGIAEVNDDEDGDEYHQSVMVDKEGSLVAWIREDPRHAVIFFLLVCIVWLVSSRRSVENVMLTT